MQQIRLGDTYYLRIYVKQEDGNPRNLDDIVNILYRMAKSVKSTTYYIEKNITSAEVTIEDSAEGIISVKLTQDDTKNLLAGSAYHETQLEASNGDILTVMGESINLADQLIKGT